MIMTMHLDKPGNYFIQGLTRSEFKLNLNSKTVQSKDRIDRQSGHQRHVYIYMAYVARK